MWPKAMLQKWMEFHFLSVTAASQTTVAVLKPLQLQNIQLMHYEQKEREDLQA